ncbi:MAG: hypothetical protein JJU06_02450 [Ectothiorhodospiraceae bacterium]|nr:hypothetical protein [Ectothiorhodospiraceae bacterium]
MSRLDPLVDGRAVAEAAPLASCRRCRRAGIRGGKAYHGVLRQFMEKLLRQAFRADPEGLENEGCRKVIHLSSYDNDGMASRL